MPTPDVRMSGFRSRTSVADTTDWIDQFAANFRFESETVSVEEACGRVLAADIIAPIDVPSFDRSAMDGFAVIASETVGATDYSPIEMTIVGESFPGREFSGEIASAQAVRIMTGAPIPSGATAVVPAEFAQVDEDKVSLSSAVADFKHIGRVGEDIKQGRTILRSGRRLRPQDIGLIASVGMCGVEVRRRPRVRIVVTGNELCLPGTEKTPHQIYEANSYLLRGLVERDGGQLETPITRANDSRDSIADALAQPGADVILVSGGSSVGAEDFAPLIVQELGDLPIHGIAMRPSSPTGLGQIGQSLVVLLPGNPVSCLCAYDFFAGRAIRATAGQNPDWAYQTMAGILVRKIASSIGRTDYCRVSLDGEQVTPLAISGASILSSTTRADGFVIVPPESEGIAGGQPVTTFLYDAKSQ